MANYFTLITKAGLAKITNAQLTNSKVEITEVVVGDGNGSAYTPTGTEMQLKRVVWRGGVTSVEVDSQNPNWIVAEAVIPATAGGFTIREVGLYDVDGTLIAIGNYPDTYKPVLADGSTMDLSLRTIIEVSNASSVTLRIDPNVIVASRKYVDDKVSTLDERVTPQLEQIGEQITYLEEKQLVLDVRDFGAVGDYFLPDGTINPSPTDDTSALQQCFDYIKANSLHGTSIKLNGVHFVQPELTLSATSTSILNDISIVGGLGGVRGYSSTPSIKNGIVFNTSNSMDYVQRNGIYINYIRGFSLVNCFLSTNEVVANGEVPLNLIRGVHLLNSNGFSVENCNITKFGFGISAYGSGLSYIANNNISTCNVGLYLQESGDNEIVSNLFNTIGWNIRDATTGLIRERYATLKSMNQLYGYAIYGGALGNTNISGGKIEWCYGGIDLPEAKGINISGVNFDFNAIFDICSWTYRRWLKANISITGCRFTSTGRFLNGNNFGFDTNSGASIVVKRANHITAVGNTFAGGSRRYTDRFEGLDAEYGPKRGFIYLSECRYIAINGNSFSTDKAPVSGGLAEYAFDGNAVLSQASISSNSFLPYTVSGLNKTYHIGDGVDTALINYGVFEVGDKVIKRGTPNNGSLCTSAGAGPYKDIGSITVTSLATALTIGEAVFQGGNIIIEMTAIPINLGEGDYVNIAGVAGVKRIVEIIRVLSSSGDKFYCKLDTPCDVAVTNAALTLKRATFVAF